MRTVALIVAVALGIAAALGVHSYIRGRQAEFQQRTRPVAVAVASRAIAEGEELTPEMVSFKEMPADSLTADMIGRGEIDRYFGRTVQRAVGEGLHLRVSHFISREPRAASSHLGRGRRAVAISVDATSGVAGLVRPGDHVDILATTSGGRGQGGASPATWSVLSDVSVLAVDDRMGEVGYAPSRYGDYRRGYSTLTLAVTPVEAALLTYLKDHAKLTFLLRPREELGQTEAVPAVNAANVQQLAQQANRLRQREIQELEPAGGPR